MEGRSQLVSILLAEDNADHAELILSCLRDLKIDSEVVHLTDGQEVLDYLFRREGYADPASSPRPQLILLDLRVPKVDGLTILRRVKADDDLMQIPIIVLTTSNAETDIAQAYDCHANSYLVKPFEYDEFQKMIGNLGSYWMAWNRATDD